MWNIVLEQTNNRIHTANPLARTATSPRPRTPDHRPNSLQNNDTHEWFYSHNYITDSILDLFHVLLAGNKSEWQKQQFSLTELINYVQC